ncbi:DegT/DnrJ/EryC1/StrS family aminotransferase [Sphingomonas sp. MAH-20]|uniref:DegT/DnrJ/EryC1/StrS family aminotransferase n=1 Tax=Sphingomonas horti TaxID=2682842 RepID=A0A6I4J1Q4_9SPHN|nr:MULTISPECIES: DegT/DnrJ/EryC1/StrS family aminotransferase [Sphingomonas]MBA2919757.1 DegT/DnrJ/EryC1/StrS family aminotransferase [Sphingomonas sp. CGMCC 1.13658]MVO77998.1 DegT/DnrJ/EryC1/StrS family aminotransferase [Sphingomonas horti]
MTNSLALLGGTPTITRPLQPFKSMGEEEAEAAARVVRSGVLSAFIGAPGEFFLGGPEVRAFEKKAADYFGVRHAISVNSWTSGLIAAVGAIGIEPGDEIITVPWTMSATAMAILHWNAIPVFADIDPDDFNIDPGSVEALVGPRTRAILAVDIFGQSSDIKALRAIADRHGLKLLTDTAQAPGSRTGNRYTGTVADIGGFSLNYHKHIHCGEGGILVTDDDRLAERLCLIRNHAESVIKSDRPADLANMIGYNFRMGEIEAAIASVQLDKLESRVASRQSIARRLDQGLGVLPGLTTPKTEPDGTHVYYVYGLKLDPAIVGASRARIVDALKAEGVPGLMCGYQNLHTLPLFRNKIAYGTGGFPFTLASRDIRYGHGTCPIAEDLHERTFLGLNMCMFEFPPEDVDEVIAAFRKVWDNLDALRV